MVLMLLSSKLSNRKKLIQTLPSMQVRVQPDSTFVERSCNKFSYKKNHKYFAIGWVILETSVVLSWNVQWLLFGQILEKLGYLLIQHLVTRDGVNKFASSFRVKIIEIFLPDFGYRIKI